MTDISANTAPSRPSKLDRLIELLSSPDGAGMIQMTAATGWQAHSVRGAMAGALKKKGYVITSTLTDAGRVWRITGSGAQ